MGNTGSASRERHKSGDIGPPSSPGKDGQAFDFTKKNRFLYQPSVEEGEAEGKEHFGSIAASRGTPIPPGITVFDPKALPTVFKWDGGGKQVYISGSFSNWKSIPMVKSHGDFVTILDLPEGEHQYKFQVDGQWMHDPAVRTTENDLGTKNNIVNVKRADFEVFDALAMDSINVESKRNKKIEPVSGSPPGDYNQEVPDRKPSEKNTGPPILPPHLLQVILNKDVPVSCEPTLLPEPNHVMLNHLYALSIKDGVMVLSATHRYRKKYVTTLLYKPI
uniref:5'-AMP-activated protein kinase subunit beta-1 n=1 Tax=Strigamia maritima TaxID=126957 RepID=T1J982_STRMM